MSVMKSVWKLLASVTLLAAAGATQAVGALPANIETSATDAAAAPGSFAYPTFTMFFADTAPPISTAPYLLTTLNFDLSYDGAALTFNPERSSLSYNGVTVGGISGGGINGALGQLAVDSATVCASGGCSSSALGMFTIAWYSISGSATLNTPLVLTAAFEVLPGATSAAVSLVGTGGFNLNQGTASNGASLILDTIVPVTATVSAVPEPEGWLMMLAGIALIATLGRRRLAART